MLAKEVKKPRPWWRMLIGGLCVLLCVWAVQPYTVYGIVNIGVYLPLAVGILGAWWGFSRPAPTHRKGWRRVMVWVLIVLVGLVAVLAVILTSLMAVSATRSPAEGETTLVVLGAQIRGESPSLMLRQRLDVAVAYLNAHPDAPCVVSGGQGPDEAYTEAHVMKKYLVERGIAPERIYEEAASTNTRENMRFSLQLIEKQGLPANLAVATQEFHQYRASVLAKEQGADTVGAVTCASPPPLLLCYWVRECAAICRLWLLGY